ncbi:MAG: hypothetical protein DMG54_24270 [Acidobacteria bacterium]|nr:MAG: hypothetical protein DMG53_27295 [Acidobacteriota bacterium]PYU40196.1 MAG: hypothetical protein DMG54_24270 [Acidobacteriota bacterium]PYU76890.1 MAG: hypothetical protein DMG52_02570 [Acidobacteriota bacterium]
MNGAQGLLHCPTIQINKRPTAIVESPLKFFKARRTAFALARGSPVARVFSFAYHLVEHTSSSAHEPPAPPPQTFAG